jgi:hypothetical protein
VADTESLEHIFIIGPIEQQRGSFRLELGQRFSSLPKYILSLQYES